MIGWGIVKFIGAAGALALATGYAQATTYDLSLIGDATDFTVNIVNPYVPGTYNKITTYPLSLRRDSNPLPTLSNGDTVDVTVTIMNGPIVVTAPTDYGGITVGFEALIHGTNTQVGSASTDGSSLSTSSGGSTTIPTSPSGGTSVEQIIANVLITPKGFSYSFDRAFSDMLVTNNGAGAGNAADLISDAGFPSPYLELDSVNFIPEPSTWAMILLGFAGLGIVGYRRGKGVLRLAD
jgi:hypothetical protein